MMLRKEVNWASSTSNLLWKPLPNLIIAHHTYLVLELEKEKLLLRLILSHGRSSSGWCVILEETINLFDGSELKQSLEKHPGMYQWQVRQQKFS